jgi:hypothetical protein
VADATAGVASQAARASPAARASECKEIERLIKKLELDNEILADQDDGEEGPPWYLQLCDEAANCGGPVRMRMRLDRSCGCDSSGALPLPAPAKQPHHAETGEVKRESGWERSSANSTAGEASATAAAAAGATV